MVWVVVMYQMARVQIHQYISRLLKCEGRAGALYIVGLQGVT
jgi:hypothetical protein